MERRAQKNQLRTVRFTESETALIDRYLEQNPIFDSFSSFARVAALTFLGQSHQLRLEPVAEETRTRPPFLWDYDLSEREVREILSRPGLSDTKRFLMERILTECRFEEVFKYLTRDELTRQFQRLSLPEDRKRHWGYALARWSKDDDR